jgi:inorganic pyrophosphatase/exopolyphosphatase
LGHYHEEKRDLAEKLKDVADWTNIDKYVEDFRRDYGHDPNEEEMREILQHVNNSTVSPT